MSKEKFVIQTKYGSYRVIIWLDKRDKVYLVKAVNLPEVVTFSNTIKGAKKMAKDALELYCDCAIADGRLIIDDTGRVAGKIPYPRIVSLVK